MNETGASAIYTTTYTDLEPPEATLITPQATSLYILGFRLLPLPKNTIVLGKMPLAVEATTPADVAKVEFYLSTILTGNTILAGNATEEPFELLWTERSFGRVTVRAMVYDASGSAMRDEITVWKFF